MKVVGIEQTPTSVTIVVIGGIGPDQVEVVFKDEWAVDDDDRPKSYVELRARLFERLNTWSPDAVCIAPLEPVALKGHSLPYSSYRTAEIRGVVAEASAAAGYPTEFRFQAKVSKTIGDRKAKQYAGDDSFWEDLLGEKFPKKYREAALLALSKIRESE